MRWLDGLHNLRWRGVDCSFEIKNSSKAGEKILFCSFLCWFLVYKEFQMKENIQVCDHPHTIWADTVHSSSSAIVLPAQSSECIGQTEDWIETWNMNWRLKHEGIMLLPWMKAYTFMPWYPSFRKHKEAMHDLCMPQKAGCSLLKGTSDFWLIWKVPFGCLREAFWGAGRLLHTPEDLVSVTSDHVLEILWSPPVKACNPCWIKSVDHKPEMMKAVQNR